MTNWHVHMDAGKLCMFLSTLCERIRCGYTVYRLLGETVCSKYVQSYNERIEILHNEGTAVLYI